MSYEIDESEVEALIQVFPASGSKGASPFGNIVWNMVRRLEAELPESFAIGDMVCLRGEQNHRWFQVVGTFRAPSGTTRVWCHVPGGDATFTYLNTELKRAEAQS